MTKKILAIFALIVLVLPTTALAADFRVSESEITVISAGESVRNVYAVGGTVVSSADVRSDLVAVAGNISVTGSVEKSLLAVGGNVTVESNVGDNARIVGGNLSFSGVVGEDLAVAGGVVQISRNSKINGDLVATGGQITIDGDVVGDIQIGGADEIVINGIVGGNVMIYGVGKLYLGDKAVVNGSLEYSSDREAKISDKAITVGKVTFNKIDPINMAGFLTWAWVIGILTKFLMALATLLVLIYLMPKFTKEVVADALKKPLANLGWGFVALVITPILAILLLVTILGLQLGFILGLAYIPIIIAASSLGGLIVGTGLLSLNKKQKSLRIDWLSAVIGIIVMMILLAIPVAGWIIVFVVLLISLGAVSRKLIKIFGV